MNSPNLTLAERKRLLVEESDALRGEISRQLDEIEASVGWIEEGLRVGKAVGKGASILGVAGGLVLAWKAFRDGKETGHDGALHEKTGIAKWIDRGFQTLSIVSPLLSLFRR